MSFKEFVSTWFYNQKSKKLHKIILSLPDFSKVYLIDIGAAGDIEPRWRLISRHLKYLGFEPDTRSKDILKNRENDCKEYSIISKAIWDFNGQISINLCLKPEVSSFYEPNIEFLCNFPNSERFDVIGKEVFECVTLDSLNLSDPDFLKIDIQGGELQVLKGSPNLLESCFGVEVEIEFLHMYEKQPLFGDVCEFMSENGFQFYDFVNLCRWERDFYRGIGQLVFGDALFLKSPEYFLGSQPSKSKIASYLAALLLYERYDLIEQFSNIAGVSFVQEYRKFLNIAMKERKNLVKFNMLLRVLTAFTRIQHPIRRIYFTS